MQLGVIEVLKGPILQRQVEIACGEHGSPSDWTRAATWVGDRFGLPAKSVQDVNAEVRGASLVRVAEVQHTQECATWRRETCDCGARERAAEGQ